MVEDLIEVKSHNLFDNTSKPIDFPGVEIFDVVFNPYLIHVANKFKSNEKKFWVITQIVKNNSKQVLKMVKCIFKVFFIWNKRFQYSKENSRLSFIQVERSDVGQQSRENHDCEKIFNILCNFLHFRS